MLNFNLNRNFMKRQIKSAVFLGLLCIVTLFSSCLKKDLPAYPLWDGTNIDNVYLEYRYNGALNYNGSPIVEYKRLTVAKTVVDATSTINLVVTVPDANGSFTAAERDKVTQNGLIMYFDVSTAASVAPVSGSPKLGELTNLAVPQKYEVTAANGTKKTWTITVTSFIK